MKNLENGNEISTRERGEHKESGTCRINDVKAAIFAVTRKVDASEVPMSAGEKMRHCVVVTRRQR